MDKCVECGKEFIKYTILQKYCSSRCKTRVNCRKWRNSHKKHRNTYNSEWMKNKRKNPEFSAKNRENFRKWYYFNKSNFKDNHAIKVYVRKVTLMNKNKLFEKLGNECKICKGNKNLQFHHITYNLPDGYDLIERLLKITIVLCRKCHYDLHKMQKTTVLYQEE